MNTASQTKVIFVVQEDLEGGYLAKALEGDIIVESPSLERLRQDVKKAVQKHFQKQTLPALIHLHFTRDEYLSLS